MRRRGNAILMQALTDGNTAPWTTVQDVTIRYNWIKNASAGATVASRVAYNTGGTTPVLPTQPSQRISFQNNLFENIGVEPAGGASYLFALFGDLQNASLLHNTGAATKALVEFDGNSAERARDPGQRVRQGRLRDFRERRGRRATARSRSTRRAR